MTSKYLTYGDLEWLLREVGFTTGSTTGHHQLFENLGFEAVILLPRRQPDERLDPVHLVAAKKNLTEKGIIDASTFDAMLDMHFRMEDQHMLLPEQS